MGSSIELVLGVFGVLIALCGIICITVPYPEQKKQPKDQGNIMKCLHCEGRPTN